MQSFLGDNVPLPGDCYLFWKIAFPRREIVIFFGGLHSPAGRTLSFLGDCIPPPGERYLFREIAFPRRENVIFFGGLHSPAGRTLSSLGDCIPPPGERYLLWGIAFPRRENVIFFGRLHSPAGDSRCMRTFPSSSRRGGCAIKQMPRSHHCRADGVVKKFQQEFVCNSSPPRPLHKGGFAPFLLLSRPPLLEEEGKNSIFPNRPSATFIYMCNQLWYDRQVDVTGFSRAVIDALGGLHVIRWFCEENVGYERLGIAVIEREPRGLDLNHNPVTRLKHMIHRG